MKKNGFTLIELLAVIVILAVIALIATPMILGVIETARKGAAESSAAGYIDAVEKQIAIDMLSTEKVLGEVKRGEAIDISRLNKLKVKGEAPEEGIIVLNVDGTVANGTCLVINNYNVYYNGKEVEIREKECSSTIPPLTPVVEVTKIPNESLNYYQSQVVALSYATGENIVNYVKTTANANINEIVTKECGTEEKPTECTEIEETTTLTSNTWYAVNSNNVTVTYNEDMNTEATLYSITYNTKTEQYSEEVTTNINKIDTQIPELTISEATVTASKITIPYTATDIGSEVTVTCKYGLEDGVYNSTGEAVDGTCVLSNLESDTTYYYEVCALDEAKNQKCEVGNATTESLIGAAVTLNEGNDQTSIWHIISKDDENGTVTLFKKASIGSKAFKNTHNSGSNVYETSGVKTVIDEFGESLGITYTEIRLITRDEILELGFSTTNSQYNCTNTKYKFLCTEAIKTGNSYYWTMTRYAGSDGTHRHLWTIYYSNGTITTEYAPNPGGVHPVMTVSSTLINLQ